jgi:hypothetical protein
MRILFLEPITPIPSVQPSPPSSDRSRSTISLPFTYINKREQRIFPNIYRQISTEPMLEKVIEVNDDSRQSTSPIEDVAQIDTELNLTLLKQESPKKTNPVLYSKATVNRCIKFRSISKKNLTIHIPIMYENDLSFNRKDNISLVKIDFVKIKT